MSKMNAFTHNNSDRRVCERIVLNRNVRVDLSNGQKINGMTVDISLGGVCITVPQGLTSNIVQQNVRLFIKDREGNLSSGFPGTIVRQGENSLCLQLDKAKSSQFGMMLTKGLFKKKVISN